MISATEPLPSSGASRRWAGRVVVAGFALTTVYFSGVFPLFPSPNELSRIEAIYSAVEHGTFSIDPAIPIFGDHEDKSVANGRFYSNKAPGLILAAIPVYRVLRIAFRSPTSIADPVLLLLRWIVVSSVCLVALARFHARLAEIVPAAAALVTFAVGFGTPFLFYARSFFSHAWTASLLFLSWDLLRDGGAADMTGRAEAPARFRRGGPCGRPIRRETAGRVAAAGFLAGWASISEYPAALVAAWLLVRAASPRRWRRAAAFAAGAAVPLVLLLAYDRACFGSPWVLSSAREANPFFVESARGGFVGLGPPNPRHVANFLVSPSRGLLIASPFWLWIAPGLARWWRSRAARADCVVAAGAVLTFVLALSGYWNWYAGWCLGNRLLLPILFFAAAILGFALQGTLSRTLFAAAAVSSAAFYFLMTATWPHLPPDLSWPVANASAWFLGRGWIAGNVLSRAGWPSLLVPAAATMVAGACALRAARLTPARLSVAAAAGLLPAALLCRFAPDPGHGPRVWRAAILGAYSGLDPARRELRREGLESLSPSEQQRAMRAWRWTGPGS